MSAVKKVRGGVSVRLEAEEAALVRALMEQLLELLEQDAPEPGDELAAVGISDRTAPPDDPVLARLFPDAYREDERAAGEFRRYTEMGLRDGKREAARTVLKTLDRGREAVLDEEEAQ
ncbi:MAG: DUF2017 family protein, partial [Actinomadura rubrobrunea]|nr:DUF2017 family protein [Actinomadura rubrobrunea]